MSLEKEVQLGKVGSVDLSLSGGKARVELAAGVADYGLKAGAFVEEDSGVFLDKVFALLESVSPAGFVAIEEGAKAILKEQAAKL